MSDVTDAQREIAGIVAEFHRKIRMRTGMVDAIARIVVSDGLSLALGIPRDGAIFGNVELVPDPGVRAAAAEAIAGASHVATQPSASEADRIRHGYWTEGDLACSEACPYCRDGVPTVALATAAPAVEWYDGDVSELVRGDLLLIAWERSGSFEWRISLMPGTNDVDLDSGTATTLDAAKAAAIAAARAWRDSIRL